MIIRRVDLREEEKDELKKLIKKGKDWRERERAETILLLSEGLSVIEVAQRQGVIAETIRERRRRWYKKGLLSLADERRSGAPSKLNEAHRACLKSWMDEEALGSRELLSRLKKEHKVSISLSTLRNEVKRLGYVWKRTRYHLKKNEMNSDLNKRSKTSQS
jgi:transposase